MQLYRLLYAAAAASDGTGTSRVGYRRWEGEGVVGGLGRGDAVAGEGGGGAGMA